MAKHTHHIDIAKLKDFAHTGVRRAIIFLGLGLNAARREDFLDYELSKLRPSDPWFGIEFFPSALPEERVREFKKSFAVWVQESCLRDLLEHYALFLDQIHNHGLAVLQSKKALPMGSDAISMHEAFRREGIPAKHRTLSKRFGMAPKHSEVIDQLYIARNALTHDMGVVLPKRCDANGEFTLTWPTFDFVAVGSKTKTERPVRELLGQRTTEETSIELRIGSRQKKFKAGDKIDITHDDLPEICHFFIGLAIPAALAAFLAFLEAHGIVPVGADTADAM